VNAYPVATLRGWQSTNLEQGNSSTFQPLTVNTFLLLHRLHNAALCYYSGVTHSSKVQPLKLHGGIYEFTYLLLLVNFIELPHQTLTTSSFLPDSSRRPLSRPVEVRQISPFPFAIPELLDPFLPISILITMGSRRYDELPRRVFGLKCSQHRCFQMRPILRYYNKRAGQKTDKEKQIESLVSLEKNLPDPEAEAIRQWLATNPGHEDYTALYRALNSLRWNRGEAGEREQILEDAPILKECEVCMDSWELENFPPQEITASCSHEVAVCNDCLTRSVDTQIPEVEWDHIVCPQCDETLTYEAVKQWASLEAFRRYE
jgi:hypothetical protein